MATVSEQSQGIQKTVGGQVNKPQLPTGTGVIVEPMKVGTGETLGTSGLSTTAVPQITPATAQAVQQVAPTDAQTQTVGAVTPTTAQTYTANVGTANVPQITAAQLQQLSQPAVGASGSITNQATVQGQLENITQDIEASLAAGTPLPAFARGAQKMAMAAMAQRGLSASTIAADAVAEGVLRASTQIAQADAQTYKDMIFQNLSNRQQAMITNAQNYFQLDMQNLSNKQQEFLTNAQLKQQFMLSDQAAVNASSQFNATNQQQTDQFFANLNASIEESNAKRFDSIQKFNETEVNKANALNAQNATAVAEANASRAQTADQFNATVTDAREKFNVDNQRIIDQSNVEWRRAINTANTAAVNAANQTDAQAKLDISNYAMNALWQQWRDEASWANSTSENDRNRAHNLAVAAMERSTTFDIMEQTSEDRLLEFIGSFALGIWESKSD
tara:strand:- start:417 stop:1757 length:1341 start_codon:yes stop_codon:yes gene_type:complete